MAYTNNLLLNNAFLKKIVSSAEEQGAAWTFLRTTARDYYRQVDFSSPARMVETFIRPLLQVQSLDLTPAGLVNPGEYLLAAPWDADHPLGMIWIVPHDVALDGRAEDGRVSKGQHWMVQAIEAARRAEVRWTVLTNGDCWRLLDVNHLRCYEAYLELDLKALLKARLATPELNLAAHLFFTIFRLAGSFDSGGSGLAALVDASLHAADKTERYLKQAVCDSLDTPGGGDGIMAHLCLGLVQAVDPNRTHMFTEQERSQIYQDATYLLYRLLFILYAEARGLLPDSAEYHPVGLENLINQAVKLSENPDLAAERPTCLWDALTALFNFIDIGDPPLSIPPFDGGLFDDSERPYLRQYKIHNTYLAAALRALAFEIDPKASSAPSRIDYRDLSVRHLGSLYEGMIEYRLFIAETDLLARTEKDGRVRFVQAADAPAGFNGEKIPAGRVYFAQSPHERKGTGTHYTAEELVEKLVRQTVLRLLDERWAVFEPQVAGWLAELLDIPTSEKRGAMRRYIDQRLEEFVHQQVLSLRVCDPAMGSGHFLVHTAHQITNFILHALAKTPWDNPDVDLSPDLWRRQVVERCLYGVDINPMAVELAKLSLWLATMQGGRPLSFLDHRLKRGNSLLGVRFSEILSALRGGDLNQVTRKSALAESRGQYSLLSETLAEHAVEDAVRHLDELAQRDASRVSGVAAQKTDYRTARQRLDGYRAVGDFLVALKMGLKAAPADVHAIACALERGELPKTQEQRVLVERSLTLIQTAAVFHWDLEFPDVFLSPTHNGFNIVIGNPPFLGGLKISSELGDETLKYLKTTFAPTSGTADLCAYFIRLGFDMIQSENYMGMVTTNTIAQGDTRETGLAVLVNRNGAIIYADRYVRWGGDANVEVNLVGIKKLNPSFSGVQYCLLDGNIVPFVSIYLDDLPSIKPKVLFQNRQRAFIGEVIRGIGFVVSKEQYCELLNLDIENSHCLKPYINGKDINDSPSHAPSRFVICFENWSYEEAAKYPDLLLIAEQKVKPERYKLPPITSDYKKLRNRWWQFARFGLDMRRAISPLSKVLIRSRVSEYNMLAFIQKGMIYSDATVIFGFDDYYHFALLQSWIHEIWLRRQASTMRTDIRYTPTDCFQTFPFPQSPTPGQTAAAEAAGQAFYEYRQSLLLERQLGLTKLYNRFNNPACQDADVQRMRALHIHMDHSILACYGWGDIDPQHDFFANDRKKVRFMPCSAAQREIFTRLMALNQHIASEEAARGLQAATVSEPEDEE